MSKVVTLRLDGKSDEKKKSDGVMMTCSIAHARGNEVATKRDYRVQREIIASRFFTEAACERRGMLPGA